MGVLPPGINAIMRVSIAGINASRLTVGAAIVRRESVVPLHKDWEECEDDGSLAVNLNLKGAILPKNLEIQEAPIDIHRLTGEPYRVIPVTLLKKQPTLLAVGPEARSASTDEIEQIATAYFPWVQER